MQLWEDAKSTFGYIVFNVYWGKSLLALLIIIVSLALRRVFVKIVILFLKNSSDKSKLKIDTGLIQAVEEPAGFLIIIAGIWLAIDLINFPEKSQELMDRVLRSMIVFSVFRAMYRVSDLITALIGKLLQKSEAKLDDMLFIFIRKSIGILAVVTGSATIVQEWYGNIGGLLAGLGLGGLAFALAAKDMAANLFGSITIMMDRPFKIGDWITTSHGEGIVEEIGFRSTRIRTFSQAVITIPNSTMSNESITNWSRMEKRRVTFHIRLKNQTSSHQIYGFIEYMKEKLREHPEVSDDDVVVCFEKFSDDSLEVLFYYFTKSTEWRKYLEVQESINFLIVERLEQMKAETEIPVSRNIVNT